MSAVRNTALRAGGACVRCRKGKTKCVYENGRAPCKNCAKGMHECYLPSESLAHHNGQSPARHSAAAHRPARDNVPAAGAGGASDARQSAVGSGGARHVPTTPEKLTPELMAECDRVISKTFPACVAFHKPTFVQQLKDSSLEPSLVYGLLTVAARSSPSLIRRFGSPTSAAENYAAKAITLIHSNLEHPSLGDIQAMCLVIIHEWGSCNAVRAYIYLGQVSRMLQMYRILKAQHDSSSPPDFLRDESFRRTLWLIYILDCLLTSTPGRYPSLAVQDTAGVALPCSGMNFAFGTPVYVKTLHEQLTHPEFDPSCVANGEVGEFGHIVVAATVWREVVGMLISRSFREDDFHQLMIKIETIRASLPTQFVDKPGQINLHITMGSGYTFAMLHCLLHCATIFVHRRRLLHEVTSHNFNIESFRMSPLCHELVDCLFLSSGATLHLLNSIDAASEKDHPACFPIFMLFSAFTASATVAYLSLRGLTPPQASETAAHIVEDGLRFMCDGNENWPLMNNWLRHLTIIQRVLKKDALSNANRHSGYQGHSVGVKVENGTHNADSNAEDVMDYDQQQPSSNGSGQQQQQHGARARSGSMSARGDSEPPATVVLPRRTGVTTINGGSAGVSSPGGTVSPPSGTAAAATAAAAQGSSRRTPDAASGGDAAALASQDNLGIQDMTADDLCQTFQNQLLDNDDLAAFMGGGV